MASPNQIRDNTHSVEFTVPSESIIPPESFYDLSESLERYSQSPDIDLPDPRHQLVISDSHSESDHDKATSSAFTPEQLVCIQQLIQARGTVLHGIRPIAAYHHYYDISVTGISWKSR